MRCQVTSTKSGVWTVDEDLARRDSRYSRGGGSVEGGFSLAGRISTNLSILN